MTRGSCSVSQLWPTGVLGAMSAVATWAVHLSYHLVSPTLICKVGGR